ncbi:MAG: molybdopterin-dependent oxidoreductase [Desulfomicrobium sp.]|nr:molybdopterin-dependent oxidoreductase [Desulfomicrobium sp.]NLV96548.1 molybdopterin-dependent oxidoreductase [Desulfovibrionales bacterium]
MAMKTKFSVCGMCSVRCPIQVDVQDSKAIRIEGNQFALKGGLCPRGAAGIALEQDPEKPQTPLIRVGARGEGKWKAVSWDEAFDYVADKLKTIMAEHGPRSVLWSDRGGPFPDLPKAFMRGLGSPNYCNHDVACARNVQHGAMSTIGLGRKGVAYDLRNAKHIILQTRNIMEAVNVAEVNATLDGMAGGAKLTVIDIRASVSASKADNFFMIRPGTDYGFNLAVIHTLINENLYNKEYVDQFVEGFEELQSFVQPYTAEWAAEECGVPAESIRDLARQLAAAAPSVIWHPGWMVARYSNSFQVCRTAYIINALLGSIGAKGGLPFVNSPKDVGRKGLKKLVDLFPKPEEKRADGVGWKHPQFDAGPGLVNQAYDAIVTGDPYPIRAYLCWRHDPIMSMPDPAALKKKWEGLDLLVSITFSWSDTAWHSDVVLPLSTYLARESIIAGKSGLKPQFFVRKRVQEPTFDSKADWEIISGLSKRLGLDALVFDRIEDIWNYQLEGTGVTIDDFDAKGFVELADKPLYRPISEAKLPTLSGKIEMVSGKWTQAGHNTLPEYKSPQSPPAGLFRITFGRVAIHTQGHTVNNPLLFELMPENIAWMHTSRAEELGIVNDELIEIVAADGSTGRIKAFVTDCIHPEALFMVHGFGHRLPVESRAFGKGVADNELMPGGLENWDKGGGCISMQEHFVSVRKI